MWEGESMLKKLPQFNSLNNFGEERQAVSTSWKILCDIFQNVETTPPATPHCLLQNDRRGLEISQTLCYWTP